MDTRNADLELRTPLLFTEQLLATTVRPRMVTRTISCPAFHSTARCPRMCTLIRPEWPPSRIWFLDATIGPGRPARIALLGSSTSRPGACLPLQRQPQPARPGLA